jgi:DNA polymerase III sliding clamp (beta) subunit (PCNA family)
MKKQILLDALEIVKPGLANKEVIEQTNSFAFIKGRVVTYNDEISISHQVPDLDITGAVKADELYQLLRKIKKDDVEISATDTEIVITAGKAKAWLTLQQEIKLPLDEVNEHSVWHKLPEGFTKPLRFAMAACSNDSSQPILKSVHVNQQGFVEGSDNQRMTQYTLAKRMPVKTFLIPAKNVKEVIKMAIVEIAESEGWVHFRTAGGTTISSRTNDEPFPDTTPFFNVKGEEINFPKTIVGIIERAEVFATDAGADVHVTLKNNRIIISSKSSTGRFEEEANAVYEGDAIEFGITPYLLKDILNDNQKCIYNGNVLLFKGENWQYLSALTDNQ